MVKIGIMHYQRKNYFVFWIPKTMQVKLISRNKKKAKKTIVIATDKKASRAQAKALNWAKKHRHEGAWFKKRDLRKIGIEKS